MPDFVLGGGIEVVIDPPVPTEVIVVPIQGAGGPGGGAVSSVNTQTGAVVLDQDDIADGATAKQYTATDKAKLAAISGTNTGDQDLSGLVPNTRTINGEPLSANVLLDAADVGAATTAQGGKADSAVQPGDLSTVATSGAYGDLTGKPTLGTAAATAASDYATAAQGATADTAVQPGDLATVATTGSASDITTGTLPSSVLPPLAINETFVVASQAAMLALTAERGDIAVRSDLTPPRVFILTTDSPSTLVDWIEVTSAGGVLSVAGKTGTVSLVKGDVGLGNVDNTADSAKPVSTAQAAADTAIGAAAASDATTKANAAQAAAIAASQPLDADLTTIAGLDSGTSTGVMATEASGWVKRTYAQIKTSLGLTSADVGLGNVDNTSDANKPVSTAQAAADATKLPLAGGTLTDGANIVLGTTTGTKIGTATTQKLGHYNSTPVVQPDAATDLGTVLSSLGLRVAGTAYPITTSGAIAASGSVSATAAFRRNVAIISASGTTTMTVAASLPFQQCNATTGAQTINLPSTNLPGYAYLLWKEDAGANTVTVQVASSGTINGASTVVLTNQYDYVQVVSTATTGVYRLINTNLATIGPISTALALKAPLASPVFTGNPTAPTPSPGDSDTSVATTAFVAAADALKADKPTLAGKTLSIYGDSWTDESAMVPTVVPTSGEMYFRRLTTALGGNSPVTYGKVSTRIGYGVGSMLSTGTWAGLPAPITGALWPGVSSRPGPVILDFLTNDIAHTNGVTLPPVAISGAGGTRYTNAVAASFEAACALVSTETRREIATGVTDVTLTGAGAASYGATYLSGGDFTWLTSSGDRVDLANVTPPQSGPLAGRVYIGTINFDPSVIGNANALVSVDGGTAWTWTNPEWESYGASGAMNQSYAVIPVDLPVDGTNHSIRVEWSGSGYLGLDVLLIPSTTPPAIYILDKPDPIVGSVWNATDIGVWKSNAVILKPAIQAAVARFSNAVWVPSTMTPGVLAYDGVHPNSAGQEQRYKDIAAAVKLRQLVS